MSAAAEAIAIELAKFGQTLKAILEGIEQEVPYQNLQVLVTSEFETMEDLSKKPVGLLRCQAEVRLQVEEIPADREVIQRIVAANNANLGVVHPEVRVEYSLMAELPVLCFTVGTQRGVVEL